MAITPPTNDDLAEIAGRYRLGLDAGDVEAFRQIITGALTSSDAVERMYQEHAPKMPDRSYQWPAEAGNELGAWYVTTELRAGDGPLAGRRVAIKDNIEVAGLPMMNGSATVEGFIPRRDATVVTRVLDAGGTITGQVGVRGPGLLGRQPHVQDRPGAPPLGPDPVRGRIVQRQRGAGRRRPRGPGARR